MNESTRTDIGSLGEFGLINRLTKHHINRPDTICGVGDDAAVLRSSQSPSVVTTDMLVEGIHFDLSYTPLRHLGYKAVVVNVSDILAMNAKPKHITVSIAISNRFSLEAVEELYDGIYKACEVYGVDVIGGDTTSSTSGLIISVTAIGEAASDKIVYRRGAHVGDLICVSGDLGAAYLGLNILIREKKVFLEDPNMKPELNEAVSYLIQRILKPEARQDVIAALHEQNIVPTAMMDISDGLSSELFHICTQSQVGCLIGEALLPIDKQTREQAFKMGLDPTVAALSGGEDYELLMTIPLADVDKLKTIDFITVIGTVTAADQGLKIETRNGKQHELKAQGWVSF